MHIAVVAAVTVHVDKEWLTWGIGFLVPLLTAIVMKSTAARALKALCTAILSVVSGYLGYIYFTDGDINLGLLAVECFKAAAIAMGSYYGLWKPTGIAPAIHANTGKFGIGGGPTRTP